MCYVASKSDQVLVGGESISYVASKSDQVLIGGESIRRVLNIPELH